MTNKKARKQKHVNWASHTLPALLLGASLALPAMALADDGSSGSGSGSSGSGSSGSGSSGSGDGSRVTATATPTKTTSIVSPTATPTQRSTTTTTSNSGPGSINSGPGSAAEPVEVRPKLIVCHATGLIVTPFVLLVIGDDEFLEHRAHGDFLAPSGVTTNDACARAAALVAAAQVQAPLIVVRQPEIEVERELEDEAEVRNVLEMELADAFDVRREDRQEDRREDRRADRRLEEEREHEIEREERD